jgi:hypothetical protein
MVAHVLLMCGACVAHVLLMCCSCVAHVLLGDGGLKRGAGLCPSGMLPGGRGVCVCLCVCVCVCVCAKILKQSMPQ